MKTKLKSVGLCFLILVFAGCATLHRDEPIDIFQRTQSFEHFSFDEMWSAALLSVAEVDFLVRSTKKEIGLIQAVAALNPEPGSIPPRVNVIIKEEEGRIDVNFHIEFPGRRDESGKRRTIANKFFKSLKRNLH